MKTRQMYKILLPALIGMIITSQTSIGVAGDIPRTVRMDRIWEYTKSVSDVSRNISVAMERYRFTGREHVGGRDYYCFRRILYKEYRPNPDTGKYELVKEDYAENSKPYYMREKDGKVYYYTGAGQGRPAETGYLDEWLVYDFNLVEGDSITLPVDPSIGILPSKQPKSWRTLPIVENGEIEIGDERSPYYVFHNSLGYPGGDYKCIAGAGIVEHGFLPRITINGGHGMSATEYMDLSRIYNDDYEVLFRGENTFEENLRMYESAGVSYTSLRVPGISYESGSLKAVCDGEGIQLELYTIDGREMLSIFGEDECRLDLSGVASGVYVAKASTSSEARTIRILI